MEPISQVELAIGRAIRRARIKAKISQSQLAPLIGLPQSGLSKIESGKQYMLFSTALLLKREIGFILGRVKWPQVENLK